VISIQSIWLHLTEEHLEPQAALVLYVQQTHGKFHNPSHKNHFIQMMLIMAGSYYQ